MKSFKKAVVAAAGFLFKKSDDGNWKIARYIFATTNPPRE